MRLVFSLLIALFTAACLAQAPKPSTYRWTQFVRVDGQPELVPTEWVRTPEGQFAHSIKIPNPVPQISSYRSRMSGKDYFEHLCKTEAGEFIFKTIDNVQGFYFMRPPKKPTDRDLMDRFKLEAPEIERYFQLLRATPAERSITFIFASVRKYKFIEEPTDSQGQGLYLRAFGFKDQITPNPVQVVRSLKSRFGLTWRGVKRPNDRELGIAGGEWIVLDLSTNEVLAVMRTFGVSPKSEKTPDGVWWLSASKCPSERESLTAADDGEQLYRFVSKVLKPQ